jgi:hypothetical protein
MPQAELERWLLRAVILTVGAGSTFMGVSLIAGGPQRFTAPGFATARLIPGGSYTWGALILAAGVAVLAGAGLWHRRTLEAGCLGMGAWYLWFDLSLIVTSTRDPHGAVTGAVIYLTAAVLCAVLYHAARKIRDPRIGRPSPP